MAGPRGTLRVYLGAAPGVGKTYAMLDEAQRRVERGTDVVIGVLEDHGRPQTRAKATGLEIVPRRQVDHRGTTLTELDVEAVLARAPEVVLVDELAHTNAPGGAHDKRWEDVEQLLEAGIEVVTTVNVQHLESLNDVVRAITGVEQRETVPDGVVRAAESIELVDMSPEALRRRIAHGNVYAPDKVDAALSRYFRTGNLTALRELALLWVADRVDDALRRYRADHDIEAAWPARERVVVAVTGGPEGDTLVRNAARVASRAAGGELVAVYVARGDGIAGGSPADLVRQRRLVESLGGTFQTVTGEDVAAEILAFARGVNATQIVLGMSRRSRLAALVTRGVGEAVIDGSGDIDVHVVTHQGSRAGGRAHDRARVGRRVRRSSPLGSRRRVLAAALAVVLPLVLTAVLGSTSAAPADLSVHLLLFLAATVVVALTGGFLPALLCAVLGGVAADVFFTEPRGSLSVSSAPVAVAVVVSVAIGAAVAWVVDQAARRSRQAADSEAEARALAVMTSTMIRSRDALDALLHQVVDTFALTSVTLLQRGPDAAAETAADTADAADTDGWTVRAQVGDRPCARPEDGDVQVQVTADLALVARSAPGRPMRARDRRLLEAFAAQAATVLEARRLQREAGRARRDADRNAIRTALLAGVSHDLRTPLAAIKAAVSSLRQPDVVFGPADTAELLAGIESGTDRLDGVVGNLLDMSRLQMGDLTVRRQRIDLGEVVDRARLSLSAPVDACDVPDVSGVGEDAPKVIADAGLLERVVANLLENARRHASGARVSVRASADDGRVELRVADCGPGLPAARQAEMFAPFARIGDAPPPGGVGLGLAVARGFVEAMDGTLSAEDTPGGGLTLVVALPAAPDPDVHPDPGSSTAHHVPGGTRAEPASVGALG